MLLRLVKEAVLAKRGDEIHALVGGCFLVTKEGHISEFSLRMRGGAFERSYGGFTRDQDILASFAKVGRMSEIEGPTQRLDYRQNPANEQFEHLHNEVIWTEHSSLFNEMKSAFPASVSAFRDHATAKVTIADFAERREVTVTARDERELLWTLSCDELDGRMKLHTGKRFNETGIVQTVADSFTPGRQVTVSGETLYIGPGSTNVLSNIDSHLAMAAEEHLFPSDTMTP
ncbi:hypothetical protein [Rhizobium sp. MHM7A]|uniref:hypothetical protein n=1 Tax=Rhizobium sp. MHM7A TaxID=2583233 RepID=UPI001106B126|nr:hypothetical protein [Rhizobium sp. MHM7A]TLX15902.1 hypothetical protein FFR93_00890 [Rhizobium sp. MHM7A]